MSRVKTVIITIWMTAIIVLFCGASLMAEESGESSVPAPESTGLDVSKVYAPYPEPDAGYVTDLAGQLGFAAEQRIEQWLRQTEADTGVEIVVVLIESIKDYPGTGKRSIESFATGLFDAYKIGNMPENNGVLLLVAINDRKARIELGAGYGRRRDNESQQIMDKVILPQFRQDEYVKGVEKGVQVLMGEFAGVQTGTQWSIIYIVVGTVIACLISYSLWKSGRRGWGWICIGLVTIGVAYVVVSVFSMVATIFFVGVSGTHGGGVYHFGGGGGLGGGGGGFGGGGGGFSGGGGASGSW